MTGRGRELGLGLQTNKRPGDYAALARIAEDGGFDVVTTFNDLWFQPALPALLEIAAATTRVRVGPSCLNPFTVHPVELAGQVATLDLASRGRAFLGLAAGAWLETIGLEQRRSLRSIAEAWEIVTRLLAGDRSGFAGEVFHLEAGHGLAYTLERHRVPLLIGSWSPRLTAFAAQRADELKLGGSANPALVRLARERLGSAAEVGVVVGAVTVVDSDGKRAREHARREVAMYLAVVAGLDPTAGLDPELIAALTERVAAGDQAGAAKLISGEVLDLFAFSGTPAQIADQAEALFDAGARRVDFGTPHGLDERAGVELLVREVTPRLGR
ncbi:MAG TPA: LLM class flavin-dependent oxidoreductase [Gaiellaceae bacterium]|nr:LLM class flavin-dependent oxidoreductase [Gaiellaceae bacterium]